MPIIATPILTPTEAKNFLSITGTASDALLTLFIQTVSQNIYNRIGVVSGSPTVEEWHDGGSERIVLRNQGPISSVTTVTETIGTISYTLTGITLDSGTTANAYAYTVDLDRGLLVRRSSGMAVPFAAGVRNIHVTYVAGYTTVPEDVKHAAKLLVADLWETQRGPNTRRDPAMTGGDYAAKAERLLAAYIVPGIA